MNTNVSIHAASCLPRKLCLRDRAHLRCRSSKYIGRGSRGGKPPRLFITYPIARVARVVVLVYVAIRSRVCTKMSTTTGVALDLPERAAWPAERRATCACSHQTFSIGRLGMNGRLLFLISACCVLLAPGARASEPQRPLRVDDLFAREGYGSSAGRPAPVAISPDGAAVAFIRTRPDKSLARFPLGTSAPWDRRNADIWLQAAPGAAPKNLTQGHSDGTGWWRPEWSPDGKYLASLSTRSGDLTIWLWSRDSNELRQLTTRNVDFDRAYYHPFAWLDATHIVAQLLPQGEPTLRQAYATQMSRLASGGWEKRVAGEVTASVLESGVPYDLSRQPQGDLVLIEVPSGNMRVLAKGNTRDFELSPARNAVAYLRPVAPYVFEPDEILNQNKAVESCALEVVDLSGKSLIKGARSIPDVIPQTLRWSPDGRELAFLAHDARRDQPPRLGRLAVASGRLEWVDLGNLDAAPLIRDGVTEAFRLEWTQRGDLVVGAAERRDRNNPASTSRREWWLIDLNGKRHPITAALRTVPRELWPDVRRSASMLAVADGELWRLSADARGPQNLTQSIAAPVSRIVWLPETADRAPHRRVAIIETREPGGSAYTRLDLETGAITPLAKPDPEAILSAYSPAGGTAVFSSDGPKGTFIWRQSPAAREPEVLMAANTFLRGIQMGTFRSFEYRSLDGQPLRGWVLLPPNHQAGRRYPLLTWVYAGNVYGSQAPMAGTLAPGAYSMQIPAAQGYAVLLPSMPAAPGGMTYDPMLALPNGVLPAVEKVIELGIADPERLFVAGHSFGGYSTYGLITQTNRFKAAVSMAGLANLISLYGTFDVNRRFSDTAHLPHREGSWRPASIESGQSAMGGPPWQELGRYIRNSPLLSADRVQTPLMIVYGDLDVVAMEQGEEFFTALYRQGKRAQFVRYWGEGHNVESPANVRDLWARIFAWLEEFGDIARDDRGALLWDGARVQSRNGAPPRTPQEFLGFELIFERRL